MKLKTTCLLLTMITCCLTACTSDKELPSDISQVGDTIIKDENLLENPTDIVVGEGAIGEGNSSNQLNNIEIDNLSAVDATVDDIKTWLKDYISGEFTKDESEDNLIKHQVSLTLGGKMSIIEYYKNYYMTEFRFGKSSDFSEPLTKYLEAYIGRPLAQSEKEELNNDIQTVNKGAEMEYVYNLSNTAVVYIMIDGENYLIQVR